jgi:hypothetical protein
MTLEENSDFKQIVQQLEGGSPVSYFFSNNLPKDALHGYKNSRFGHEFYQAIKTRLCQGLSLGQGALDFGIPKHDRGAHLPAPSRGETGTDRFFVCRLAKNGCFFAMRCEFAERCGGKFIRMPREDHRLL